MGWELSTWNSPILRVELVRLTFRQENCFSVSCLYINGDHTQQRIETPFLGT
jgi:hypothetical protein